MADLTAPWLTNTWYVAASSAELTDKPLGRTICGQRIVFYRRTDGSAAGLEDFCPHRGAPLSLGFCAGDHITCGYHGLQIDGSGRPASMPGQSVEKFPAIRSYAVIERHGFIWIWPRDEKDADPSQLVDPVWSGAPDWAYGGGLYHIKCDYRLMVDNLMDLTHETYVHAGSIGQKEIDEAPVVTSLDRDAVVTRRTMDNVLAPPFWRMALRSAGLPDDQPVDRWQICRFSAPSHVMIEVGVALAGHGGSEAPPSKKVSRIVVDYITPETETSHWYFWGMARNFVADDEALTASIREGQGQIFAEDLNMLESQQANLLEHPQRRLLTLNIDAGGAQSRALISRLIRQGR